MATRTEELQEFTVPTLKQILKDYGLAVSGRKADLIQRIITYVSFNQSDRETVPTKKSATNRTTRSKTKQEDSEDDNGIYLSLSHIWKTNTMLRLQRRKKVRW